MKRQRKLWKTSRLTMMRGSLNMRFDARGFLPLVAVVTAAFTGCSDNAAPAAGADVAVAQVDKPKLGLMTSLPLYWPLGADFDALAAGESAIPWQRTVLERDYDLVLLDTLSPMEGLSPDAAEVDPLEGVDRLAVIQPRGLSGADNVALDQWVRDGGHLLIVLDPMLTGHYELALGDPRRPVDMALVPPVIERWGLGIGFDETQDAAMRTDRLGALELPVVLSGQISRSGDDCALRQAEVARRCPWGAGQVLLVADASIFEHEELAGEKGAYIQALMQLAFEGIGNRG